MLSGTSLEVEPRRRRDVAPPNGNRSNYVQGQLKGPGSLAGCRPVHGARLGRGEECRQRQSAG